MGADLGRRREQICLLPFRLRAYKYQGRGYDGGEGNWALGLGDCWIFAEGMGWIATKCHVSGGMDFDWDSEGEEDETV